MENKLQEVTNALKIKIEKLIHLHNSLKAENQNLQTEVNRLKEKLDAAGEENRALKEKQAVLKLSNAIGRNEERKTEAKRKINDLIREIDRCITMLNN